MKSRCYSRAIEVFGGYYSRSGIAYDAVQLMEPVNMKHCLHFAEVCLSAGHDDSRVGTTMISRTL